MRNWHNRRMDKFEYIGLPPGEERSKLYLERMHDLSAQIIINDTGLKWPLKPAHMYGH